MLNSALLPGYCLDKSMKNEICGFLVILISFVVFASVDFKSFSFSFSRETNFFMVQNIALLPLCRTLVELVARIVDYQKS